VVVKYTYPTFNEGQIKLHIQPRLFLRDFILRHFALTRFEIYTNFRNYAIMFGVTLCCHTRSMIARLLLEASRKRRHCHAGSDIYGLITLVI